MLLDHAETMEYRVSFKQVDFASFNPVYTPSLYNNYLWGFPGDASGKEPACQCRRRERHCWRSAWQPTPVFLSGEFHGQRSQEAAVHRVSKSRTRMKRLSTHTQLSKVIISFLEQVLYLHCLGS